MTGRLPAGALLLAGVLAACAGTPDGGQGDAGATPPTVAEGSVTAATAGARPVPTEVVATEPAVTEPAATEPAVTEPPVTEPPVTEPPVTEPATPDGLAACAAALPLRERIALLVWPAVYPSDWATALTVVEQNQVGGVVLFAPDDWGPDELTAQLDRLDRAARRGLVIATDEEGGNVQRLAILGTLQSQQEVSEELDPDQAQTLIAAHGERVAATGVDMVLGPVVDVVPPSGSVPLTRSRFFSGDATTVERYARAYIAGWESSGLAAVLKHYPGHGAASADTHDAPGITPDLAILEQSDLVPFRRLADTDVAVMVGHLTVPDLTGRQPATLSAPAVTYLRDEVGYGDALVMTDALGMQAVGRPEDEAAVLALVAGIDVVIFTNTSRTGAVVDAIERAVDQGMLTDERITLSAIRVLRRLDPARTGCGGG